MRIVKKIIDINRFNAEEGILLYKNGEININSHLKNIECIAVDKELVILLGEYDSILNFNDFPNIPKNYSYSRLSLSKPYFILIDEDSIDNETFIYTNSSVYSVNEKRIVCSSSMVGDVIFDDYVFAGLGDTEISYYKIQSEPVPYTFSLSNLGTFKEGILEKEYKVMEFSGLYKNILVCTLNSGSILLLDIEKGEVHSFFDMVGVRKNMYAKSEGSPIYYGLSFRTFIEIDVEKGKIIRKIDLNAQLKQLVNIPEDKSNWSAVGTAIYKEGLFYFNAENYVAIFDPKIEKIVDSYSFNNDNVTVRTGTEYLQAKDGKVYCLDTSNTLHILEREYIGS